MFCPHRPPSHIERMPCHCGPDTIPRFEIKGCAPKRLGTRVNDFAKNDNAQDFVCARALCAAGVALG